MVRIFFFFAQFRVSTNEMKTPDRPKLTNPDASAIKCFDLGAMHNTSVSCGMPVDVKEPQVVETTPEPYTTKAQSLPIVSLPPSHTARQRRLPRVRHCAFPFVTTIFFYTVQKCTNFSSRRTGVKIQMSKKKTWRANPNLQLSGLRSCCLPN